MRQHRLTVQDAEATGCCSKGIERFSQGQKSMSVARALRLSRHRKYTYYRDCVLSVICHKFGLSVSFALSCLEAVTCENVEIYVDGTRRAQARSEEPDVSPAVIRCNRQDAATDAAWAASSAAQAALYTKSELDRQDQWILDHLPALDKECR